MSVSIAEFKPTGSLQPYVESFWYGEFNINELPALSQNVIPYGCVELIIHLSAGYCKLYKMNRWDYSSASTIIGLFPKPYEVRFTSRVAAFGIRLKPESIYQIFGVPASEFLEDYSDMETVAGNSFQSFCSQMRDLIEIPAMVELASQYILNNIIARNKNLYYLNRAAELIRNTKGLLTIEDVAKMACVSTRQLVREFRDKIGITPKAYMRIARLNEVNRLLKKSSSSGFLDITYECGYADQAHFIREFKDFTGVNPRHFIKNRKNFIVNPY